MRILIIEDDRSIAESLKQALRPIYDVDVSTTGRGGISRAGRSTYEAVLLDLNLPDMSGEKVCAALRGEAVDCPILVLTGRDSVADKVALLGIGADDYIVKPFHLDEVKARLSRAVARAAPEPKLAAGELELDRASRTVLHRGRAVQLRRKEFELLECLLQHKGRVVTREIATDYISDGIEQPWTNVIDVYIKRLRDKIDRPFGTRLIRTVHGVGYKIDTNNVAERRVGV